MAAPTKIDTVATPELVGTNLLNVSKKADLLLAAIGQAGEAAAIAAMKTALTAATDATYA